MPLDGEKWPVFKILRIFGTAQTYRSGKGKLKLAEQLSDIGSDAPSDNDSRGVSRRSKHSRVSYKTALYSSDDEKDSYPKFASSLSQPLTQQKNRGFETPSNVEDASQLTKRPTPQDKSVKDGKKNVAQPGRTQSGSTQRNDMCDQASQRFQSREGRSKDNGTNGSNAAEINNNQSLRTVEKQNSVASLTESPEENGSVSQAVTLTQLHQTLKDIYRKVNLLTLKLTNVETGMRDIRECLSDGQIKTNIDDTDLEELGLPFGKADQLKNIDRQLSEVTFRQSMVKALKVIGGGDVQAIVSGVLARTLQNPLAEEYSYKGHKGKKPFKDFNHVVALINNVVRMHKSQATDKEISEAISTWLSQAKTRRVREVAKLTKRRAEEAEQSRADKSGDE